MKNLENFNLAELSLTDLQSIDGGKMPDNYNEFLGAVLFPFYTLGYILGNL